MRLSPSGQVYVCGPNWTHSIGSVTQAGLRSIWDGPEVAALRGALDDGDFSLGCDECASDALGPLRSTTHASAYDGYALDSGPWPLRIEFALSNICNLQCVQCTGELSSAIRSQREKRAPLLSPYGDEFFEELDAFLPHLQLAEFVGGEPFLARENRRVWDRLIDLELSPQVHVTTNATVWNDRVEHYLRALKMNVTLSIDGASAATNDTIRIGSDIESVRQVRDRIIDVVAEYGGHVGVNHCLMRQNWHELPAFLQECEDVGLGTYVCRVIHPSSVSLLAMDGAELRDVVTYLQGHDEQLQSTLVVNREVWTRTLGMLGAHLERVESDTVPAPAGTPVELGAPDRSRPIDRLAAADELVAAWSPRPAIELSAVNGRIVGAQVPAWAEDRLDSSWIGGDLTDLFPRFEHLLRVPLSPPTTDATDTSDDVQVITLRSIGDHAPLELRAYLVSWVHGSRTFLELRVSVLGDLAAPVAG